MWLNYGNTVSSVRNIEEGIERLLKLKEVYNDAYLEFEGKRLYARDIVEGESIEEKKAKIRDITDKEYIKDIEEAIEMSDGDYSDFDLAYDIRCIPDNSVRISVMTHFIDRLGGIPALTDSIARAATPEERKKLLGIYRENCIRIDKKIFEPKIWIVPNNDLEAKTIIDMLERNGEEYIVTSQAWGASWENLEPEIKEKIEKAKEDGKEILGVELQGNSKGAKNIDHHIYYEDDRSNPKSSIEQVAEILGVELTLDEQFISANDKGYIPAMEKLGAELGIPQEDLKEIIANIRMRDREMQGVTLEQEAQAQEAVGRLGEIKEKRKYIQLDLPHSKTSTVTDRLYGKYENLLITSEDGETNFFGTTEIIQMLNEKFPGGWSGGQLDQGSGFWGGYADQEAIKNAVQEIITRQQRKTNRNESGHNFEDENEEK